MKLKFKMELKTPDLSPKSMILDLRYVNKLLGMKFKKEEVKDLLLKMGFDVELDGVGLDGKVEENENLKVLIPPYRVDILHQIDLVEDIAIAYGYENFIPENIKVYTVGRKDEFEKYIDSLRLNMLGYGFSEIMSLIMTNKKELFEKMNLKESPVVETENAISSDYCVIRSWLLPSLMSFLEKNKTKGYPQNLFEIGKCVEPCKNPAEREKLSFVIASSKTNFSDVKAIVEGFLTLNHLNHTIRELNHGSFIEGRCAEVLINGRCAGFFGEIHPKVLENFNLEVPVTAFELDINEIYCANL